MSFGWSGGRRPKVQRMEADVLPRSGDAGTGAAHRSPEAFGLDFLALHPEEIEPAAVAAFPASLAERFHVVPVKRMGDRLVLAAAAPLDLETFDLLATLAGVPLDLVLAPPEAVEAALNRYYRRGAGSVAEVVADLDEGELLLFRGEEETTDLAAVESIANEAPIVRLVNLILLRAVEAGASDIHLEPFAEEIKVRYRIDGVLYEVEAPPKRLYPAVVSRLKLMAGMDITEKRLPQDGRIRLRLEERDLDLRVAVAPTLHGESVVLRILNRTSIFLPLEELGFSPAALAAFNRLIRLPHGMILVTGPTGSGKTTTLYAAISKLDLVGRKVITIEDPVEYELKGVNQMQVNPRVNFGFAQGVRTIVRHDPDVILVGEIRDRETAEVAVHAALTGHLVFATLHTNDAAGAFTRLLEMGVEEYLVAATVRAVLAQRLVRRLCPHCRFARRITEEERERLGWWSPGPTHLVYEGRGCRECRQIGYRGQIGIFELLVTSPAIEELVMARANTAVLREQAMREGMVTLRQDGLTKIAAGITSIGEVLRVTRD
ncbi:MAG: type II/IV secretion system protein [Firmicutes bacterium]|nr:type II/IV secretion system protein [Bacillota bacterium]